MTKKQSIPTTFQEKHRYYFLDIFPEGRMGSGAQTAEGILQTIQYLADGKSFTVAARYKETQIGHGRYRKCGPHGHVEAVETQEAEGVMVGLIELALAKREEQRQAELRQARADRLTLVPCPSCGHALGYDSEDHCFADRTGEALSLCERCDEPVDLDQFQRHYELRIRQLQTDLRHAEDALRRIQALKQ